MRWMPWTGGPTTVETCGSRWTQAGPPAAAEIETAVAGKRYVFCYFPWLWIKHFFVLRIRIQFQIQFQIQVFLKKPSFLKRGHPTLQNMNFYKLLSTFVGHFCPPGSGFRIHRPDWIRIEYGSNPDPQPCKREHPALQNIFFWVIFASCIRIQQLKLMRIHADPDPQPCHFHTEIFAFLIFQFSFWNLQSAAIFIFEDFLLKTVPLNKMLRIVS